MTSTNLINAIVGNNNGASLIDKGDYQGAVSSLSSALNAAKHCMSEDHDDDANMDSECQQEVHFDLDSLMMKETMALQYSADDEDGYFVYSRPIRISEANLLLQRQEHQRNSAFPGKVLCSAVSIFNLALAHHLSALSRPSHSLLFLKKAAKLYDFGIQVLQGGDNNVPSKCGLFYLAILNNLGDVHRRLQNTQASERYCHELLQMLLYLSDDNKIQSCDETLDVFYQNSFFYLLSARGTNAAPAA